MAAPYTPTDDELALLALMSGYKPGSNGLKRLIEGGWRLYDGFYAEEQAHWFLRILGEFIPQHALDEPCEYVGFNADWDEVLRIVRLTYTKQFELGTKTLRDQHKAQRQAAVHEAERRAARLKEQMEASEDPAEFVAQHPEIVATPKGDIGGRLFGQMAEVTVTVEPVMPKPPASFDPGDGWKATWLLDHLTHFTVFSVYSLVYQAAHDAMQIELLALTDGDTGRDIARATYNAFQQATKALGDYMDGERTFEALEAA